MNAQTLQPVVLALQCYEQRLRDLRMEQILPGAPAVDVPDAWVWLRDIVSPAPVPADAFLQRGARLCVAPTPLLWRGLLLRALYARRSALRRCIDRRQLAPVRESLSAVTLMRLTQLSAHRPETTLALPDDPDMPALLHEGLQRLVADGSVTSPGLIKLVSLQLPLRRIAYDAPAHSAAEAALFQQDLPLLLPELP